MSQASDEMISEELVAPSLRRRMACWIYEGLLLFGVVFLAGYLFSTLSQSRHALDNRHGLQAFLFLIIGLYFTWFGHKGQTLAMKTWRIRVVDIHGQALTQQRAFARYLLSWIWFIPPLALLAPLELNGGETLVLCFGWVLVWALLSRFQAQKQFWHDVWAGTRLITSEPLSR
jgi:uncharacterized RDD family membrane protein YckC